jgi:hypothetical protein
MFHKSNFYYKSNVKIFFLRFLIFYEFKVTKGDVDINKILKDETSKMGLVICYECKKPRRVRSDCSLLDKKMKCKDKKYLKAMCLHQDY